MEAARAIWNIIGEDHVQNFVVVGGAALLFHGVVLPIYDTDRAITGDSLNKFYEQAMHDARLTQTLPGAWEYHSSYGFHVEVDFLDILGQGGYMHELKDHCIIGGIPVATLTDLALGKGGAWKDRGRLKDLLGFEYAHFLPCLYCNSSGRQ